VNGTGRAGQQTIWLIYCIQAHRPEEISLSYNGGKDCLVLLILILACLPAPTSALQAVYIAPPDSFPEVEDFVASSAAQYHLDLARYALAMRPALKAYLGDRTAVKAIFIGTRRTDPHGELLTHFHPTDKDWPQFMRVNPMIDWHYAEIWAVSTLCLPYSRFFYISRKRRMQAGEGRSAANANSSSDVSAFPFAAYTTRALRRSAA
jgi:FAD synthetase